MMIPKYVAMLKRTKFSGACALLVVAPHDRKFLASRVPFSGYTDLGRGQETIDYWAAALFLFEQTPRLPEAIVISLPVRE